MNLIRIALDGPAGAGKSTIARKVAEDMGIIYVDTGAMYRALGLYCIQEGIDLDNQSAVEAAVENAAVELSFSEGKQHVLLNGATVDGLIRTEEVSAAASKTSAYTGVRAHLLALQRNLAESQSLIMDGRDIGTTVLPHAEVKIFLTAAVEVRAERRYLEMKAKGAEVSLEEIEKDIRERDHRDMTREVSPLKKAEDATVLDTSDLNIEEVCSAIKQIITEKTGWK